MSKVKQYIEQATNERIRSRGLIRSRYRSGSDTERRNEAASYRSV